MGDIISWTIFGTIMVAAVGVAYNATLKSAGLEHSLKLANEEIASLRKQIKMPQEETKKLPLSTGDTNAIPKSNVTEGHNDIPKNETLVFTSKESPKIAQGIKVKTEFKKTGWYCVLNDIVCMEHNRTLQPDNISRPYEYTCKAAGCKVKIKSPLISFAKNEAKDLTEAHIRTNLNIEPKKTNRLR